MQVETFECTETASEPIEATEEAVSLIEELGLSGQMELVRPKTDNRPAARCPYRHMTEEERFVYQTVCPQIYEIRKYNATPIPLRVLQIAAHVTSLGICGRLQVWDNVEDKVKDPVLVGVIGDYDWDIKARFILARWGEVLETFSVLLNRAAAVHRQKLIDEAKSILTQAQSCPDAELMRHSGVGW